MDALASGQRGQLLRPATFLELDGLPNREANGGVQSSGIVGPGGRLWFPTMAGPVVIDPARIGQFRIEPAAVMEGIRTGGRLLSPENSSIKLPPGNETSASTSPRPASFPRATSSSNTA